MTEQRQRELLPCPFCGGEGEVIHCDEQEYAGGYAVQCKRCWASTRVHFATGDDPKPHVVSAWNTRTLPNNGSLIEQLRQLTDDERLKIFASFCTYCGSTEPDCKCMMDD